MLFRPLESWEAIGGQVARGRKARGWNQQDLADRMGLDRTAVSRIESGQRAIDALELGALSRGLGRPLDWFLTSAPPAASGRRGPSAEPREVSIEALLDSLALDVALLVDLGYLAPVLAQATRATADPRRAEGDASGARRRLGCRGPARDLSRIVAKAGLYAFSLELEDGVLGCYRSLGGKGVAAVNGALDSGRRRFALAHLLGHHLVGDECAADWDVVSGASDRERAIDAFAAHFLLPRKDVARRFESLARASDPRGAAIHIGEEFGAGWSATCTHLRNLRLISSAVRDRLIGEPPGPVDYIERELTVREELAPPQVPPCYAAAVLKAHRGGRLGATRVLRLMRGALRPEDLPPRR